MMIDADDVPPSIRQSLAGKRPSRMRVFALVAVIVLLAAAGTAYDYFWLRSVPDPKAPLAAPIARVPASTAAAPADHYPITLPADAQSLPMLADSDPEVEKSLSELWGGTQLAKFFELKDIIRRVVATVDNLPRASYAIRLSPVKPVPGEFLSTYEGGVLAISPGNAVRYLSYARLLTSMDVHKAIALYTRFYPLLQRAYQDLGYPNAYFNDRVIEAIDICFPDLRPSPSFTSACGVVSSSRALTEFARVST